MPFKFKIPLYLFLCGVLLIYLRGCDKRIDDKTSSPVLNADVKEKIVIDPAKHVLHMIQPSGHVDTIFLPDRPSSIEIKKDGKAVITVRAFGTELSPFIGFAYSDQARLALGVSGLYWHRWELGAAVFPTVSGKFSVRAGPLVNYTVYDNTSLFLGVTTTLQPIGGISLKF